MSDHAEWIGYETLREDVLTARLLAEFRATLDGTLAALEVPPGLHLCLGPDIHPPADLGRDGHPRPGLVLPALPLPRRMWAGGELRTHHPLPPGARVMRRTRIEDVTFKTGRSGRLGFVAVRHVYSVDGRPHLEERQDIVYREDPGPDAPAPTLPRAEPWGAARGWDASTDSTRLFRYSALTFNGHRIHYDAHYAREVEGYGGLVVHGPLQAAWMQNLAASLWQAHAPVFTYRGLAPLICGEAARIEARETDAGLDLRVRRLSDDAVTMTGTATR